ncbi:leishmanolysin-related zinc metalloendopeptidase [Streptomyces hygroscopicus]|uniref:leishmanolysin-related zinc metalloendopeptidase n=1 Tax=Streptomyces hygroscopicus TaxID=1912 RepID=UPI003F1B1B90
MIMDKNVRDKTNQVAVVKSEKTKQMAQEHYGCSTADGMELEDGAEITKNRRTGSGAMQRMN